MKRFVEGVGLGIATMGPEKSERRSRAHEAAAATLAALCDGDLAAMLNAADWRVSFHGSESAILDFAGWRVFAKRMALTRRELDAGPAGSVTADLFGLPSLYQYAVGSAGFAAGRELAAARMTSGWALAGACPHFPILHHARVLPRTAPKLSERQEAWRARIPTFWSGNPAIIARVDEVTHAPANIVMIQEFVGRDLETWLQEERPRGAKLAAAHDQWMSTIAFMNKQGLFHFDLHARNLLTDGEDLYLADFGYALGSEFDLSAEERAFLASHADYDSAYARWAYARWLEAAKRRPRRAVDPRPRGAFGGDHGRLPSRLAWDEAGADVGIPSAGGGGSAGEVGSGVRRRLTLSAH